MMIIKCSITDFELMNLPRGPMPFIVKVRLLLNKKGIRFVDDDRFSSTYDEDPKPIGTLKAHYHIESGTTFYKQIIEEKDNEERRN